MRIEHRSGDSEALRGTRGPNPGFRILITGSREWEDVQLVHYELLAFANEGAPGRDLVVVHGACPKGADAHAQRFVEYWKGFFNFLGVQISEEPHPADWNRYGKSAGPKRNVEMVSLGADICLAFIRNGSRGASHTADLAEKAGIETRRFLA